jgi:sec-independent protein translocase protein TatB
VLDIGFSEIALIFTLALIVLGPEKLPRVASQVGRWIGRARGMARQFREQLEEEVNLEEVRKSKPPAIKPPPPAEAAPAAAPVPEATAPAAAEAASPAQPTYPDNYSHAHPTDADGRPLPSATDGVPLSQADSVSATAEEIAGQPLAQAQQTTYPDHYSHAHPTDADGLPLPAETQHQQYPDHYSHAHPTDAEGRPLPPPTSEAPADDSGQHDWVGAPAGDNVTAKDLPVGDVPVRDGGAGVTATDKPAQGTTAAGYAPPHERGT